MHPLIKSALRRSWRDRQTVQYGVSPAHAVKLGPVDHATGSFLDLLDGTRNVDQLRESAERLGLGAGVVDLLLGKLRDAGVLDDSTADRAASAHVNERLWPDLASLSVLHPEPGGAVRRLAKRRTARVQVRGGGRVGAAVAALLSASGVAEVEALDGGCVTPADCAPGGITADRLGERRSGALRGVVRRAAPWSRPPRQRRGGASGYDLVIFAPRDGLAAYAPDPELTRELVRAGRPHLYTGVVEATGFVGPLVVPGVTACADCLLQGRAAREPGWPLVVGQWRMSGGRAVPACDGALASVIAGAAANAALRFLDGDGTEVRGARVSFVLPQLRREEEQLPAYEGCSCGAALVSPPPSPRIPEQHR